jgi:hypothetical protein
MIQGLSVLTYYYAHATGPPVGLFMPLNGFYYRNPSYAAITISISNGKIPSLRYFLLLVKFRTFVQGD